MAVPLWIYWYWYTYQILSTSKPLRHLQSLSYFASCANFFIFFLFNHQTLGESLKSQTIWECQTLGFIPPGRFNAVQRRQWRKCGPWKLLWRIICRLLFFMGYHLFAFQNDPFPNSIHIWLGYIVIYYWWPLICTMWYGILFFFHMFLIYRDIQLGESYWSWFLASPGWSFAP